MHNSLLLGSQFLIYLNLDKFPIKCTVVSVRASSPILPRAAKSSVRPLISDARDKITGARYKSRGQISNRYVAVFMCPAPSGMTKEINATRAKARNESLVTMLLKVALVDGA